MVDNKINPQINETLPENSAKILASSIFKNLKNQGCDSKDIIKISSHLLGLVNDTLKQKQVIK